MAASADARIATSLPSHPKTKKLVKRLGGAAGWHLVCLFLWAAANRPDGDLDGLSDEDVELAVDWSGEDGAFVEALAAVGFLDGEQGARRIHDWAEHNPWAAGADARKEKASFAALVRQHGRAQAEHMMPDYAKRLREARKQHEENERGHAGRNPPASPEHAGSNEGADLDLASSSASSRNEQCPDSVSDSDTVSDSVSNSENQNQQGGPPAGGPPTRSDPVPYQRIVDGYNAAMVNLPKVRELTPARKTAIRTAWQGSKARQSIEFWSAFWLECASIKFLNGQGPYTGEHANWRPDFDFLIRGKTVTKVFEKAMDRMERGQRDDNQQAAA